MPTYYKKSLLVESQTDMYDHCVSVGNNLPDKEMLLNKVDEVEDVKHKFYTKTFEEFLALEKKILTYGIPDEELYKVITDGRLNAEFDCNCFFQIKLNTTLRYFHFEKFEKIRLDITHFLLNPELTQNSEPEIKNCWFTGKKRLVWLRCYFDTLHDILNARGLFEKLENYLTIRKEYTGRELSQNEEF